jgi:hypothetical protein
MSLGKTTESFLATCAAHGQRPRAPEKSAARALARVFLQERWPVMIWLLFSSSRQPRHDRRSFAPRNWFRVRL